MSEPAVLLRPPAWTVAAACIGKITGGIYGDPWHPPDSATRQTRHQLYDQARRICLDCPVQVQCTRWGIELLNLHGAAEGMFGGLTPDELAAVARKLTRRGGKTAQHGTRSAYVGGGNGSPGCRCDLCRRANTGREHDRRVQRGEAGIRRDQRGPAWPWR